MKLSRRTYVSAAVFLLLGSFVFLGYWYQSRQVTPGQAADSAAIQVTNGDDRGPGTLREALFIAAAARNDAVIVVQVPKVTIATALPPIVSPAGMRLVAHEDGTEIDASALPSGPVFDVAANNVIIEGFTLRNCAASAIVLRAERFRLQGATLESCDVGIDIAENAALVLIENNRFIRNRVGVRLAAANRNTIITKNDFTAHRDAGVWAVRNHPDVRGQPVTVRENRFNQEDVGILTANISLLVERNELLGSRAAAIHLMGAGALVRGNRISGGDAMGVVVENARGAVIEQNEFDGLAAYGIMVKSSADTLLRGNRIHSGGYGLAFVLGDARNPSTALDNTIIEPRIHGVDVIGDSPILRGNQVLRPHALALKVIDFTPANGQQVRSAPVLEGNNFNANGVVIAAGSTRSSGALR